MPRGSLALKYRPHKLSDVVGQPQVTRTLERLFTLVRSGKVYMPAGFLFSGSRGTGKTSTARIIGAALNCTSPQTGALEPCGECPSCQSVWTSSSLSVLEVDAASHGLVADARRLGEMMLYDHPGAFRVVILDECHSMSREAFNALLHQLEEPPPDVMYVLLTTEPRRVLPTVASRLVGFDFRRLGSRAVVERLEYVCRQEEISYGPEALELIARRATGSLRDALMMVDHLVWSFGVVAVEGLLELVGDNRAVFAEIITATEEGDIKRGMTAIGEAFSRTCDPYVLIDGLTSYVVDVLLVSRGLDVVEYVDPRHQALQRQRLFEYLDVFWALRRSAVAAPATETLVQLGFMQLVKGKVGSFRPPAQPTAQVTAEELDGLFSALPVLPVDSS